MERKDRNEDILQRLMLCCDSFTTAYFVFGLFFLLPYCTAHGGAAVLAVMPIACLLPFALMPLAYYVTHKADSVLFGRYHFIMPIAAIAAATLFAVTFTAKDDSGAGMCAVVFGGIFFILFVTVYRYCAFSVRARLTRTNVSRLSWSERAFGLAGGGAAIAATYGFYAYDSTTVFANTAYTLAAACIVLAVVQQLSTFYRIPQLGGSQHTSVKGAFVALYGGIDVKTFVSGLLLLSAFAVPCIALTGFATAVGLNGYAAVTTAATVAVCYAATAIAAAVLVRRRNRLVPTIAASGLVTACILLIVAATAGLGQTAATVLAIIASGIIGVCGALSVRNVRLRFLTVKAQATSGTVFVLIELAFLAAGAVATIFAAITAAVEGGGNAVYAYAVAFGGGLACAVAAMVMYLVKRRATSEEETAQNANDNN